MKYSEKYKSDFQKIEWDDSSKILKTTWNTPINISEELYRNEVLQYLRVTEEMAPKLLLVDAIRAYYNVRPDTQDWINERSVILNKKIGLQKMAFIVSSDIFSQMSFEKILDKTTSEIDLFKLQYFDDEHNATDWLINSLD
ncbi:hypothetical protein [Flammeovirga sp. SJP92]|uniref:hypothetical protein n=1 Tax=Flammeovirga sp. SJP92 TaxID=1775430 RepID=UPI0007877CC7|nr:hypothetical protein [Flammeovirga sp. SJP92]KXX71971.1 hypothetical protein AVL50_04085 [Flammeovirga sp. SJP92]